MVRKKYKGEKSMKKLTTVLVVLIMATMLFAQGESDGNYKIQLITMDQMDQHWVNMDKGAKQAAEELGNVTYSWNAPAVKDDAQQIECVNNAVAQGVDAILIAANGPDAITASLKEADAAGVKIIYVDSGANYPYEAYYATDNKAAGTTAGNELLGQLTAKGITSGTIGVISTNPASLSTLLREEGFAIAFAGTDFQILPTQYCDGDAQRSKDAAANFITQGVVGLFGANEGSTVGVGNAIHESGIDVVGVGFDKSDMILQLVKNGYLYCTMAQNPDVMGYEGVMAAAKVLAGETISPKDVDTGVSVLTADKI